MRGNIPTYVIIVYVIIAYLVMYVIRRDSAILAILQGCGYFSDTFDREFAWSFSR